MHDARQRFGSLMMRHGELGTDFRPLRLTVAYHAPCPVHGYGIGKRLIAARAEGDLAGAIDDLAMRLR